MKTTFSKIFLPLIFTVTLNLKPDLPEIDWSAADKLCQAASEKFDTGLSKLLPVDAILNLDMPSFKEIIQTIQTYAESAAGYSKERLSALAEYLKLKKAQDMFESAWSNPVSISDSVSNHLHVEASEGLIKKICGILKPTWGKVAAGYAAYKLFSYVYNKYKSKKSDACNSCENNNNIVNIQISDTNKDKEEIKRELLKQLDEAFKKIKK